VIHLLILINVVSYWDWTLDTDNVPGSSIWDAKSGFGGDGTRRGVNETEGDTCVQNGPFKDMTLHYLHLDEREHCLRRQFNAGGFVPGDMLASVYTPEAVSKIHQLPDYNNFRISLEGGPHGAVHSAIGGDMSPSTSPNGKSTVHSKMIAVTNKLSDPIFFMHHTQIDRLWTLWQNAAPENRTLDFSGIKTQDQFDGTTPPPASLQDIMPMLGLADDVTVREYMSTTKGPLCYTY
jgi:tyrosinase